jgi:hypothetical protein
MTTVILSLSKGGCPTEDLGHDGLRDRIRKYCSETFNKERFPTGPDKSEASHGASRRMTKKAFMDSLLITVFK